MALHLERVRLADIEPLVDEYGNEFVNRDYGLKVNKDYVRSLAESFGPGGEPDEPVKLIRDGGGFRIKAGNSRVRAMQLLGTEECWAVIDDEDTVQSVVETVVRTNVKKKYEPAEESRFVQQLAMFGDDEYVGEVASIGAERAARLRRGVELAGERAEQMSLDRLYVLPELEGFGNAVEQLCQAKEAGWKALAQRLQSAKAKVEGRKEMEDRAAAAGIPVKKRDEMAEDARYVCRCGDPSELEAKFMEARASHRDVAGTLVEDWGGWTVYFYGVPLDGGTREEREEGERRRRADALRATAKTVDDSLLDWVGANLVRLDGCGNRLYSKMNEVWLKRMPHVYGAVVDRLHRDQRVKDAIKELPVDGHLLDPLHFACGYMLLRSDGITYWVGELHQDDISSYALETVAKDLDFIQLHVDDGWEPDADQAKLIRLMRAKTAKVAKPE